MCRHLAYLGPPVPLGALLIDPPHGLLRQSWAPRRQRYGTVNADGFGVGWYADGDPIPARYRRDRPIWTDAFVTDLARVVRSRAIVAAVRSGTEGMPYGEAAAAPFAAGQHLFSHNGRVPDWPGPATALAANLPPEALLTLESATDSALLWALVRHRLGAGATLATALADVVQLAAGTGGRLNFLAADGHSIAATAWGDTLWWRADGRGVVVASEPFDDDAGWREVPDRSLLTATPDGVAVAPLPLESTPGRPAAPDTHTERMNSDQL
jgi:glutamine amidotransferase